ncbi:hypothetical protein CFIICLFH_3965 [Methylobacterium goesingense]|nr:hypothetical protein CFIICLFH_3965 [Methylobacterium goesingense]
MPRSIRFVPAIAGFVLVMMQGIGGASAQEPSVQAPLFLRIRPAGDTPAGLGGAGSSDEEIIRAARARSEAVWQRAEARSRIAIASVCTGCIPTPRPAEPIPAKPPPSPSAPHADGVATIAAGPPAAPIQPLAQADAP